MNKVVLLLYFCTAGDDVLSSNGDVVRLIWNTRNALFMGGNYVN